jgi:hypothetical protein
VMEKRITKAEFKWHEDPSMLPKSWNGTILIKVLWTSTIGTCSRW